ANNPSPPEPVAPARPAATPSNDSLLAAAVAAPQPPVPFESPTLTIQSDPPEAQVFLGHHRLGVTPVEVERPSPGSARTYVLTADGRMRTPVIVRAGSPRAVHVSLPERPVAPT